MDYIACFVYPLFVFLFCSFVVAYSPSHSHYCMISLVPPMYCSYESRYHDALAQLPDLILISYLNNNPRCAQTKRRSWGK